MDEHRAEAAPDRPGPGPGHRPGCASLKSNNSMFRDLDFKRAASSKTERDSGFQYIKSDGSIHRDLDFKDAASSNTEDYSGFVSLKSNNSMFRNLDFKGAPQLKRERDSGFVSVKSNNSMFRDLDFKGAAQSKTEDDSGSVSLKSDGSMFRDLDFKGAPQLKVKQQNLEESQLDAIFTRLEDNIISFVKDELKKFHRVLGSNYPELLESEDDEAQKSRNSFLTITLDFLQRMKQEELADCLRSRSHYGVCQSKLKSTLKQRYRCVFEGIPKPGNPTFLNQIFTELYITEGGAAGVNEEHEVRQIETASRTPAAPETTIICKDIFKDSAYRQRPIRTVLTKGVAGIGKTVLTQKFSLDWAEDQANKDIHFLFPFTFRNLNVLRDRPFSLMGLVQHFFSESAGLCSFEDLQVVFIFDGLDECRLPLDFRKTQALTDPTESTSVDVLLVNLIRGSLLPSARLWITTRPAAANQIPAECVSMVTEVRGFTDPHKEQYFRNRFTDEEATAIISHIRTSRSLYIMCHIPIFCWITATVLHHVMETGVKDLLPQTLTEMYIHFLVVQTKVKNLKFTVQPEIVSNWSPDTKQMVEALGKLAFEQLQKGNLIFYESDLIECGLDVTDAAVYSGVFTQVFREEPGLYQDKVYCFVHLSVQEFLAALHVHLTFYNSGTILLSPKQPHETKGSKKLFYQTAIDQALRSPNGHLDLFLRFLLGLSLPTNQSLLVGLVTKTESASKETLEYIKQKINDNVSTERILNLFHCLNELNDRSLIDQIQKNLRSGHFSKHMSPADWSALAFILLSSDTELEVFDLKKYCASEEVLLRLLPVVKASNKAILTACNLREESCKALSSVLSSQSLCLKELDLSYNSLRDSGVELLAVGLQSPHCSVETLRLQYCNLSVRSCGSLSSVLAHSSKLRHLDLSNNDLCDSGMMLLSVGLKSPDCRLESLRLSGCMVSSIGCSSLTSALSPIPFHLKELDLSYNYPALAGVNLLSSVMKNLLGRLKNISLKPSGERFLKQGRKKYFFEFTLDPNTAYRKLRLSDDNRTVTFGEEELPYPAHPDRFDLYPQVLGCTALTDRCYWEVEWRGVVSIAVSYREIGRKGDDRSIMFGQNNYSWRLWCSDGRLSVCENEEEKFLNTPPSEAFGRVAVYLDCAAGFLSFFSVLNGRLIPLHTFHTNFTQPLFAGFGFGSCYSSVSLITPASPNETLY